LKRRLLSKYGPQAEKVVNRVLLRVINEKDLVFGGGGAYLERLESEVEAAI